MSLAVGEVFAGYSVVRLLGSDGMGEVYLAKHAALPRQDAIRVLPARVSVDAGFRARFAHDAELAATLWHPHLVGVHGHGEYLGRLWIATDFAEGYDAAWLMRDRHPNGMPAEEVVDIVTAIADALDYAHGRHLPHGDVRPANILLTAAPAPRILLTGFGIPRQSGGPDDQYALAATASHLLSGTPPSGPALGATRPELAAFDPALGRALAPDPSARFGTCLGFAAALRDVLADTARFDGPETGPKEQVFVPAWSQEPAPNPYLDPYPDEPYSDPDPAHSPTMTSMPAAVPSEPQYPPPTPAESDVEHPSGPTGRTWAMAAVAAVVVLVIVAVIFVARGESGTTAQPSQRPAFSNSQQPPTTTAAPVTTANGRAAPPPVTGPDGVGETCLDGYQITGRATWASHGVRGNSAATCAFAGNVLKAYWDAADPDDAPRTIVAAGAIPCSDGAQCSGDAFVVICAVEGSDPWVTCRGGHGAVVVLY